MAEKYEFNKTQYEQLVSFKNTLHDTGVVCKQQVISLEASVGVAVITRNTPINGLSEYPTKCGASTIAADINVVIENASITDTVKPSDIIGCVNKIIEHLKNIRYYVVNLSKISDVTISRMTDAKYTSHYDKDTLIDISKDRTIQEVLSWYTDYTKSLADTTNDPTRYDTICGICDNYDSNSRNIPLRDTVMPLICLLLDAEHFTDNVMCYKVPFIRAVTLPDVVTLIKNAPVLLLQIDETIKYYNNDKHRNLSPDFLERYYINWDGSVGEKYVREDFNKRHNLTGLLSDPASFCLLEVLVALA